MSATVSVPAHIRGLPLAWRILASVVVTLIGLGYVSALVNIIGQNELVDGKPGLTIDDLRLKYAGAMITREAGTAPPSRMLEMIQGSMRQYFSDATEFDVLYGWLQDGATAEALTAGEEPTPADVLLVSCLGCHSDDGGHEIADTASFGPSQFELPEHARLAQFATVVKPEASEVWVAPRDWRSLALTTHAHMLSVPIFVVLLAGLFLWSRPLPLRHVRTGLLAALPLLLFLVDVACWWLARLPGIGTVFLYVLMASGGLFAATFLGQWAFVLWSLWRKPANTAS